MKAALYGRLVFGASAVMLGIVMLVWHDAGAWEDVSLRTLPFSALVPIAQIAGGILVAIPRTARPGAIVLGVVYLIITLTCVPVIVKHPTVYVAYGNFFEWFSVAVGAFAAYATTVNDPARVPKLALAARVGFGICTVSFTLAQIAYPQLTASLVPSWIVPSQMFWMIFTTIAFGLAAIALLINVQAVLATRLMTAMLALFGVLVWVPMVATHPESHFNWAEFALNFLITGAAWTVASSIAASLRASDSASDAEPAAAG